MLFGVGQQIKQRHLYLFYPGGCHETRAPTANIDSFGFG